TAPKPSPINDTVILVPPPEREARLESRTPLNSIGLAAAPASAGIEGSLARLQGALDRYEAHQVKTLNTLEESYDAKARRMRGILADLGLDLGKIAPSLSPPSASPPERSPPAARLSRAAARSCPQTRAPSRDSSAKSIGSSWYAGKS